MDCQMPGVDGFEATRRIRAAEAEHGTLRTPIVAMTANAMAGDRERCLEAGMDDYVAKPVQRGDLLEVLVRQLGSGAAGTPPVVHAATAPRARTGILLDGVDLAQLDPESVDPDRVPLLDLSNLRDLGALEPAGIGTLIEFTTLFAGSTPDIAAEVSEGLAARDLDGFRKAAHKLKGSAPQIGAWRVGAIAWKLDLLGKAGTFDGAAELLDALDIAIADTIAAFQSLIASVRAAPAPDGLAAALRARAVGPATVPNRMPPVADVPRRAGLRPSIDPVRSAGAGDPDPQEEAVR
jgi:CheY-like chemotaxis protein